MQTHSFYRIVLLIGLICSVAVARAGDGGGGVVARAVLDGSKNQVRADSSRTVEDSAFFNAAAIGVDTGYSVQNIITLKINEASPRYLRTAFTATVMLRIIYSNGSAMDSIDRAFTINYDSANAYNARNSFVFYGGRRVTVKVLSVDTASATWDITSVLLVENQLTAKPKYLFSCSNTVSNITVSPSVDPKADELPVTWTAIRGADQYDLEWTYVDASALVNNKYGNPMNPALLFHNNATRVTTTANSYNIPLIYDNDGTLFIRVRPVQVGAANSAVTAIWSSDASPSVIGQYIYTGHERPLNWQSSISFAEEGKRKVVVQYYDGSMHSRQTVTRDNTTNKTIVAETYYDYQGRPAIQVMPAPSLGNIIQYTAGFNVSINNPEYSQSNFDTLINPGMYCSAHGDEMDTLSGASRYYSTNNPNKTIGMNQFIPDAQRYPFAETEYTPDNTGRISRQGGVGKDYQLGNGHETKYYYGTPDQKDLDALFGTDVGDASHYFKNMVRDANGQYSVSYVDMHGRTIATALAGKAPEKMAPLASNDSIQIIENLAASGTGYVQDWSMVNQKSIVVPLAGSYTFNYSLDPSSLIEPNCDGQNICYSCLYDLQITITDNCNNQSLPGGKAFDKVLHNFSLNNIAPDCTPTAMNVTFTLPLAEGSYQVTKQLTISRDAYGYYRDSIYLPGNTCRTLDNFIKEQRTIIAQSNTTCIPDCQSCRASVGTLEQFKANFIAQAHIAPAEVDSYSTQIAEAYKTALEACNTLCDDSSSVDLDIRAAMLQDLTPPYGQYADTIATRRKEDLYSIFYIDAGEDLLTYVPVFRLDDVNYLDANGQPDKVYDQESDLMVAPGTLSMNEFTQSFRASWAEALLPYHPEYCKLRMLESLKASNIWDRIMESIDNYQDAVAAGYLNPTGNTTSDPFKRYPANATNTDPLITLHPEKRSKLEGRLSQYMQLKKNGITKTVSLWTLASTLAKCDKGNTACIDYYHTDATRNFDPAWCEGDLDMAWKSFRQLYLAAKQEIIDELVNNPQNCTPKNQAYDKVPTRDKLVTGGHQPQFNDNIKTVITESDLDYASNPDQATQAAAEAQRQLNEFYDENCKAMAKQWAAELSPCSYSDAELRDVILPLLKGLCRKACDQDHPFGASSLPAGVDYEGYHSFQEIITTYNNAHTITNGPGCNPYMITSPAPYDKQPVYANKPVFMKPADCECKLINDHFAIYIAGRFNSGDASFAAYMQRTQGVIMTNAELNTLRDLCNNAQVSTDAGLSCSYLSQPIYLPPALQCNTGEVCTSCTVVNELYQSYKQQYPSDTPAIAEADDALQIKRNALFQHYMNNRLGYSLQAWEYLQFMRQCADSAGHITNVTHCVDQRIGSLFLTAVPGRLEDVQATPDRGYIMAGKTGSNAVLIKTDSVGAIQWSKQYDGSSVDSFTRVRRTNDNGYIAIGTTKSGHYASGAILIVKTNAGGDISWKKTIGFGTPLGERGYDIIQTTDGGYAALGIYNQHTGFGEFVLTSLQDDGTINWTHRFGTSRLQNNSYECLVPGADTVSYDGKPSYGLLQDADTLLVTGAAYDRNVGDRYYGVVHRINKNDGNLICSWHYADSTSDTKSTWFRDIYATENGYLVLASNADKLGTTNAQVSVVNLTKTGEVLSYKRFNVPTGSNRMVTSAVFPTSDGGYMIAQTGNNSQHIIWQRMNAAGELQWSAETALSGKQTVGRIIQKSDSSFAVVGDNNGQMLILVVKPNYGCYDNTLTLGATSPILGRINWAPVVSQFVSPVNTDVTLSAMALSLINNKDSSLSCPGNGNCYNIYEGPRLCGKSQPVFPPVVDDYVGTCTDSTFFAVSNGTERYKVYLDSLTGSFEQNYISKCLEAYRYETFTVTHIKNEYHYTLYYYDQAGNLIRTVPPAGVHEYDTTQVRLARAAGTELVPAHTLYTDYRYNTLNQVVVQHSPDGGTSNFWYDRLGRLSVSQNAKQKDSTQYSYTKFDVLGRITEVGQLASSTAMSDATSRSQGSLETWLTNAGPTAEQITKTSYDHEYSPVQLAMVARNLRNRVSWTALFNTAADLAQYNFAAGSFYSYDILGNVDTLLQYYKKGIMFDTRNGLKKIVYDYDLVSGKVNQVSYQPGLPDAFYHRYVYDAENRITNVLTSADSINWDNDAFYQYYDHGPLARTIIGEQQVQGINYAYNLQGWMKMINPDVHTNPGYTLKPDGSTGSIVGKPAYNLMLNYFKGDYKAISGATPQDADVKLGSEYRPLFNGNISSMAVNIEALHSPLLYNYQYDQLNRLVAMDAWKKNSNDWSDITKLGGDFQERVSYDPNGNILGYKRNGNNTFAGKPLGMDSLTYKYVMGTNRLDHVNDSISNGNYDEDIDNQPISNYRYDAIGNLIKDSAEKITSISWTVYGKISRIIKGDSIDITYTYGPDGNRISKTVIKSGSTDTARTWYVRDAQGNVMSVYESGKPAVHDGHLTQSELHLYGSSRLGVLQRSVNVDTLPNPDDTTMALLGTGLNVNFGRGQKLFELGNHLGNVLVTVSDRKFGVSSASNSSLIDHYEPQVVSAQDYYPFGMLQPGRSYNAGGYRYGFNGKENDNEVKGEGEQQDYGMRVYDPRLGRFLSVDPLAPDFPWNSPYAFAENKVIWGVDLDGAEFVLPGGFFAFSNSGTTATMIAAESALSNVSSGTTVVTTAATTTELSTLFRLAGNGSLYKSTPWTSWNMGPWIAPWQPQLKNSDSKEQSQQVIKQAPQKNDKPQSNPQRQYEPQQKPIKEDKDDDDDDFASVRFQVQTGTINIASNTQTNKIEVGVTKEQAYSALKTIHTTASKKESALVDNKDFRSAIIRVSEKIKAIKGGISKGVYQTTIQEKFKVGKKEYRIDVEVQRGKNFKK
jgi:RHS repeat-associated protein